MHRKEIPLAVATIVAVAAARPADFLGGAADRADMRSQMPIGRIGRDVDAYIRELDSR
jgi:hypothetical protein